MNTVLVITAVIFEAACLTYMGHRGIHVCFQDIRKFTDRIIYGPPKQSVKVYTCEVIHETARLETEIYGRVLSASIAEHISHCSISKILQQRKSA